MRARLTYLVMMAVACGNREPPAAAPPRDAPASAAPASAAPTVSAVAVADIPIPNARRRDGDLLGGQPSVAQIEQARRAGYGAIISLQQDGEDGLPELRAAADRVGLRWVSIPIGGAEDLSRDNAERLARELDAVDGPALVTCASGNRVGALYALKAFYVDRKPVDEAVNIGLAAGMTRLEAAVRSILSAE